MVLFHLLKTNERQCCLISNKWLPYAFQKQIAAASFIQSNKSRFGPFLIAWPLVVKERNCVFQQSDSELFLKWCIYIKIPVIIPIVMPLMWLLPTSWARSIQFTVESLWSKQFMSQTLSKHSRPLRTCNIRDVHFGEGAISYFDSFFFFLT